MGYCITRGQKTKGGALRGIESHMMRLHASRTNPDIIAERTPKNETIISARKLSAKVGKRIRELKLKRKPRTDATYLMDFIATASPEDMKSWPLERQRAYFRDSYEFFANRYGRENVMYAVVHHDEATPHIHIGLVPVTPDGRLSARDIYTPQEMQDLQTAYHREVGEKYGLQRGERGGKRKHLDMLRFKVAKRAEELAEAEKRIEVVKTEEKGLTDEIEATRKAKDNLVEELELIKENGREVTASAEEVVELDSKDMTNLFFFRALSNEGYKRMAYLAANASGAAIARDEARQAEQDAKERAEEAEKEAEEAKKEAEEKIRAAEKELKRVQDRADKLKSKYLADMAQARREGREEERGHYSKEELYVLEQLHKLHKYDDKTVYGTNEKGEKVTVLECVCNDLVDRIEQWENNAAAQRSRGARTR